MKFSGVWYGADIEGGSYSKSSDKVEILVIGGSDIKELAFIEGKRKSL